jgi:hypothetical protein
MVAFGVMVNSFVGVWFSLAAMILYHALKRDIYLSNTVPDLQYSGD